MTWPSLSKVIKMPNRSFNRVLSAIVLGLVASSAQAHTGHGASGFFEGLSHPFGLDHLLAMVAVGMWSVSALPAKKMMWGPCTFLASLVVGATLGAAGLTVPYLENLTSLSVMVFGGMLVMAQLPIAPQKGLAVIAFGAALHGLTHGAESPETGFATYALGFFLTTAFLHLVGVFAAKGIRRWLPSASGGINATLGVLFSSTGLYLFSQL